MRMPDLILGHAGGSSGKRIGSIGCDGWRTNLASVLLSAVYPLREALHTILLLVL